MSKSSFYRKCRRFLEEPEAESGTKNPVEHGEESVFYQESAALQDKHLSKKTIQSSVISHIFEIFDEIGPLGIYF